MYDLHCIVSDKMESTLFAADHLFHQLKCATQNCTQQHFVKASQCHEYTCCVLCSSFNFWNWKSVFSVVDEHNAWKTNTEIESKRAKIFTFSKVCLDCNRSSLWKHFAVQLSRSPNIRRNSRNQSIHNALPLASPSATYKWINLLLCQYSMLIVVSFVQLQLCF